ncbi:hypothetical protein AVEN_272724-1 [Araneus ventricosus]|uniref:Uncharacterized protein n=1 Tax=Araneus ventricosus TaxID=182803 RepID=A0A4Y2RHI3_ARAVE|nr:hypothetical protein AVEN_272724-1 [Araneus ventricosus]
MIQGSPGNVTHSAPLDIANTLGHAFAKVSAADSYSPDFVAIKNRADGTTVNDHDKLTCTVNSGLEPMAMDNKHLDSPGTEIEPDNVMEYNPNKTIDEIPPVLEQQPSTSSTTTDKKYS